MVTPAGLKAWARRVRAEARGGSGEGILGWHRRAISAYTWCITEKGPQKKWLHHIKKADTTECVCHHQQQTGKHLAEECSLLADARKPVEREEMRMWNTRHIQKIPEKKKKGPVEPEKETEKEPDRLELFFCHLYEFHNPAPNAPAFVPAELPPRYAIDFVPAASALHTPAVVPSPPVLVPSSSDYSVAAAPVTASPVVPGIAVSVNLSVVSSANFVLPISSSPSSSSSSSAPIHSSSSSSSCIGPSR